MFKTQKGAVLDSSFYLTKSHLNNKLFSLFSGIGLFSHYLSLLQHKPPLRRVQVTAQMWRQKSDRKKSPQSCELRVGLLDVLCRRKKTQFASLLHTVRNVDFTLKLKLSS